MIDRQQNVIEQHKRRRLALHATAPLTIVCDKIDDRRILNNLREDGNNPLKKQFYKQRYQLHTIISATALPAAEYPIQQRLYETAFNGSLFIIFDVEKSKIKSFYPGDSGSAYRLPNKKGRPTYSSGSSLFKFGLNDKQRLLYLDHYNKVLAQGAIKSRNLERGMNETLLKINAESMSCIGATASKVNEFPGILLELIYSQNELMEQLNVKYPIFLFNNNKSDITLNLIDFFPITIQANQFYPIDVIATLKQLIKLFPDGIKLHPQCHKALDEKASSLNNISSLRMKDFFDLMKYSFDENGNLLLPTEAQLKLANDQKRKNILTTTEEIYQKLSSFLIPFEKEDNIIVIHKKDNPKASDYDKYDEICQAALKNFIIKKIFNLSESDSESLADYNKEKLENFTSMYNLQFRLGIYIEILAKEHSLINYFNLNKDLEWGAYLLANTENLTNISTPGLK